MTLPLENPESLYSGVMLVNIFEEIVKEKVLELMDSFDMCKCETCILNACAIALNELKPKYVTTTKGALIAKFSVIKSEYQTAVDIEVIKALKKVKDSPLH